MGTALIELGTADKRKLREHEEVIANGLGSFVAVGNALMGIRDDKLYVESDKTFEAYCGRRWNIGRRRAYQLIHSSSAVQSLCTLDIPAPSNEAQARVLAELTDEQDQATVWAAATETAAKGRDGKPKVTAAHIKKTAAKVVPNARKPKKKSSAKAKPAKPPKDDEGAYEIKEAIPLLKKAETALGQLTRLRDDVAKIIPGAATELKAWYAGCQSVLDAINAIRKQAKKR